MIVRQLELVRRLTNFFVLQNSTNVLPMVWYLNVQFWFNPRLLRHVHVYWNHWFGFSKFPFTTFFIVNEDSKTVFLNAVFHTSQGNNKYPLI